NIGTCVTALLSSIGTNKNAKRVAVVHVSFNILGTVVFLAALYIVRVFADLTVLDNAASPASIAIIHTAFNVATTFLLFPFAKLLEKLAKIAVRGKPGEETKYVFLDERLLAAPTIAIAQCHNMVVDMGNIAHNAILVALETVPKYDEKSSDVVRESEQRLDEYEDKLNTFLIKLSAREMSDSDSWKVSEMLHIIGDLERIGDHALKILESAEEMKDKELEFSVHAKRDLEVASAALSEIINMTIDAFERGDTELAGQVEPLEEAIDLLVTNIRSRHVARLQGGECQIVPGFVWSDLMVNYERVSDHCSNIAACVLQTDSNTMDLHVYLSEARMPENQEFIAAYNGYKEKFKLDS
ncbi:MAG: Na/Pi symporter, partial [Oscillospiraceae bacterium]|nr:Na/Pi symporter [Oscillospiraceae bacterium]